MNTTHKIPSEFLKISFNIIFPPMPWYWNCIFLHVLQPRFASIYHPFCACYRICPSPPFFDNSNMRKATNHEVHAVFSGHMTRRPTLRFQYYLTVYSQTPSMFFTYVQTNTNQIRGRTIYFCTSIFTLLEAVPRLKRLVTGLTSRESVFNIRPVKGDLWWTKWHLIGLFPGISIIPWQYHPTNAPHRIINQKPKLCNLWNW